MKKLLSLSVLSVCVLSLAACTPSQKRTAGTVAGGIAGGLIGSQFGAGGGKTAATIGGALGGAYIGNTLAKDKD